MTGERGEAVGVPAKLFVFVQRHLHRFGARLVGAFADPLTFHLQGFGECFVDAFDLLVDEPVQRLVAGCADLLLFRHCVFSSDRKQCPERRPRALHVK